MSATANDTALLQRKSESTPEEFAQFLLSLGPIRYWEKGKFWLVTESALAEQVMRSPEYSADRSSFFISRMPNLDLRLIGDFFGVISKMMVMSDDETHGTRRQIAGVGISEELSDRFRPQVKRIVDELITEAGENEHFDFVEDLAMPLPSRVLAELFCIPEEERKNFYAWSNHMTQFFGGASQYRNEDGVAVNKSAVAIRDYFAEVVRRRKVSPENDFLSRILPHQARFGLNDSEVVSQAVMMLVAGQITTTDQLCNNLFQLLTVPGVWEKLRDDRSLLATAIEECNRLDPAVTFLFRVVREPVVLGGQPLEKGAVVFVANHAVNRDPRLFTNPSEFVPSRAQNPHFAYGHGPHFCLGARLARIQMLECFGQLLERFPNLALAGEAIRKHHSLAFSGFETMPLLPFGRMGDLSSNGMARVCPSAVMCLP